MDSQGEFSLDPGVALNKLRQFRLAEPQRCLCNFVAAAVLSGATRFEYTGRLLHWTLSWDGTVPEEDELHHILAYVLSRGEIMPALPELAVGLHGALQLMPSNVVVAARTPTGGVRLRLQPDGRISVVSRRLPTAAWYTVRVQIEFGWRGLQSAMGWRSFWGVLSFRRGLLSLGALLGGHLVREGAQVLERYAAWAPPEIRVMGEELNPPPVADWCLVSCVCEAEGLPVGPLTRNPAPLTCSGSAAGKAVQLAFLSPVQPGAGILQVIHDGVLYEPARQDLGYRSGFARVWCSGLARDLSQASLLEDGRTEALRGPLRSLFDRMALELAGRPDVWDVDPQTTYTVLADLAGRLQETGRGDTLRGLPVLQHSDGSLLTPGEVEGREEVFFTRGTQGADRFRYKGCPVVLGAGPRIGLLEAVFPGRPLVEVVVSGSLIAPRKCNPSPPRLLGYGYLARVQTPQGELGFPRRPPEPECRITLYAGGRLVKDVIETGYRDLSLLFPHGLELVLEVPREQVENPPVTGLDELCAQLPRLASGQEAESSWARRLILECFGAAGRAYFFQKGKMARLIGRLKLDRAPFDIMVEERAADGESGWFHAHVAEPLSLQRLMDVPIISTSNGVLVSMRQLGQGGWHVAPPATRKPRGLDISGPELSMLRSFLGLGRVFESDPDQPG